LLAAIKAARAQDIPDHLMRVLVVFNQLGQMKVEVNEWGSPRHESVVTTYMALDNLATAELIVDDSPLVGAHPADVLGLLRR
jgi:hypothetical protein